MSGAVRALAWALGLREVNRSVHQAGGPRDSAHPAPSPASPSPTLSLSSPACPAGPHPVAMAHILPELVPLPALACPHPQLPKELLAPKPAGSSCWASPQSLLGTVLSGLPAHRALGKAAPAGVTPWKELRGGGAWEKQALGSKCPRSITNGQSLPFTTCERAPDVAGMPGVSRAQGRRWDAASAQQSLFGPRVLGTARGITGSRKPPGSPEPPGVLQTLSREDIRLPEHLTNDGGGVQVDQGCVCLSLQRRAWDVRAGIGVLIIIAVVKLKALARVVFRLGGGAWASGKQPISWKEGGVSRVWSREAAARGSSWGPSEGRSQGQDQTT